MSDNVKRIDIAEFRERGYLQEVNRLMLHPLGLALEVVVDDCKFCAASGRIDGGKNHCEHCDGRGKTERLGGVWDYRDDPEGMMYAGEPGSMIDPVKVKRVADELDAHVPGREAILGAGRFIQTPGSEIPASPEDEG
jgi:hypothetical protein